MMPFWSGETLKEWIPKYGIVRPFDPNDPNVIDCAAVSLTLGQEALVTPLKRKLGLFRASKERLRERDTLKIPPGQFAFLVTEELISMPNNVLGFISLRSRHKFKGLVNVSGFHVDPGYEGNLIYAVYNAGPQDIHVRRGDRMFLLWLACLDQTTKFNYREAKKREGKGEEYELPRKGISVDMMNQMSGEIYSPQMLAESLRKVESTVRTITITVPVIAAVLFGLITAVVNWKALVKIFD